jgi:hypothetical protein
MFFVFSVEDLESHTKYSGGYEAGHPTIIGGYIFPLRSLRVMNYLEGSLSKFSTFVYGGSSHRRKSAACPKFDMVWQYRSSILVGRRGVISSFK